MPCPRGRDAVYEVRLGDSLSQWSHGVALGGVWRAVGCPFAISAELSIQFSSFCPRGLGAGRAPAGVFRSAGISVWQTKG
jgi:hypothetical protein